MKKLLFITDMDGTLLPSDKNPNPVDLAAIKTIKEQGGLFTLATGRGLPSASKFYDILKPNFPAVLFNGGMIYDFEKKEEVFEVFLPESAYKITGTICEKFPYIGVEINAKGMSYAVRDSRVEEEHIRLSYDTNEFIKVPFVQAEKSNWYKVLFAAEPDEINELIAYIRSTGYDDTDFVRSCDVYYEMLPKGVSKGSALKKLVDLYNLQDYTIAAAGDYYNDIELLEAADIALAPQNALDCVKAIADYTAKASCDDGFLAEAVGYVYSM
ncbi:MAG: Cof-type HAD-IIB family hydrolase [Oscillospiraceae bacterium]|nr:Cof-type HAD-IIB family hydrolase [Oscillospiraceae bacterium]